MTDITFWAAVPVDWTGLTIEAMEQGKQLDIVDNTGLKNKIKITPDLSAGQKTKLKTILEKSFADVVIS